MSIVLIFFIILSVASIVYNIYQSAVIGSLNEQLEELENKYFKLKESKNGRDLRH